MIRHGFGKFSLFVGALLMPMTVTVSALAANDPGKKACGKEARKLCPAEVKSLSRKKVEACMIANIERTTPVCKAAMLQIKAEREAKAERDAKAKR